MEQYEQQLLEALRASLRGQDAAAALRGEEAWRRLWELAAQQKVLSLAADALASRRRETAGFACPRRCGRPRRGRQPSSFGAAAGLWSCTGRWRPPAHSRWL